jgi:hypothetical protein
MRIKLLKARNFLIVWSMTLVAAWFTELWILRLRY